MALFGRSAQSVGGRFETESQHRFGSRRKTRRWFFGVAPTLGRRAHLCLVVEFSAAFEDYERLPRNSEALIQVAMMHLLLKRLATFREI